MTIRPKSVVAVLLLFLAHYVAAQNRPSAADVEKRVDSILGKMTLDEKIEIVGGINDFYTRPILRLGIPSLRMSDGPMGVHDFGLTTAYPAGIALAASWDVDLAERFGASMGKDARARGVHFILGPGMNIYRAPMNGRNFEYFGEDPFLASQNGGLGHRWNAVTTCDRHCQALCREQFGIRAHDSQLRHRRKNPARNLFAGL